jgi:hypothetical protein
MPNVEDEYITRDDMNRDPQGVVPPNAGLTAAEIGAFMMFAGRADNYCYRIGEVMDVLDATRGEAIAILKSALRKLKAAGCPLRDDSLQRRRMRVGENLEHVS